MIVPISKSVPFRNLSALIFLMLSHLSFAVDCKGQQIHGPGGSELVGYLIARAKQGRLAPRFGRRIVE